MRLADLCDCVGVQVDPSAGGSKLYVGLEHIDSGRFICRNMGRSDEVQSAKFSFQPGDILYGKLRPYLDKAVLAADHGICTTELLVLRPKDGIDPQFLIGVVHSPDFVAHAVSGTTGSQHPRTSWTHISEFRMPALTPPEMSLIAHVVWRAHNALVANEELTSKSLATKWASLQTVMTGGVRGEPLKEESVGSVPASWHVNRLGEIAEIAYGAQAAVANATDPSIGTLILTNVNLDLDGHINLDKRRYYKIPVSHRERLSLEKGDVLFNWRSGSADHIGKTVYFDLDGDFTYSSFILRFRPHRSVTSRFLFWWLTHLRRIGFFTAQRNVSSINSVYNASLSATIPIWFPENDEQNEIVGILDGINSKIDLHRRKAASLDELLKILLHKLMTGQIRTAELDMPQFVDDSVVEAAS